MTITIIIADIISTTIAIIIPATMAMVLSVGPMYNYIWSMSAVFRSNSLDSEEPGSEEEFVVVVVGNVVAVLKGIPVVITV